MRSRSQNAARRTVTLKVVPIGNSRGVRLPKTVLSRYRFGETIAVEEHREGLLLKRGKDRRLSWEETYKEMAEEREDWSDFDATIADGLDGPDTSW